MLLTRMTVVLSLLAVFAAPAHGQQSSRPSFVIGGVAAGMLAQQESDNLLGLGLSAGVERELSPALTVRTLATVLRSGVGMGDDVGICIPAPDDGCLPTEAMPEWHSTLEVTASVALFPAIPVRLHTGIGIALAWQARKTASSHPDAGAEWSRVIRGGLELPLGAGRNAPRLVVSRAWLGNTPYSLHRLDGLSILFPR